MKLSTIIRAIVRPHVAQLVNVSNDEDMFAVGLLSSGRGFGLAERGHVSWVPRAQVRHIGDLEIAWWGRDTFVHQSQEAS